MFLKPSDPLLTKISQEIPQNQLNSAQTKKIADLMLKIIQGEQKGKKKGVGLAAPQIGILKRIILVDVKADGTSKTEDLRIYINPEIIWSSKRKGEWYEGCFSTGKVCGIVSRPVSIKIQGYTLKYSLSSRTRYGIYINNLWIPACAGMTFVKEQHTGYIARIFQHEIDHLNGKLIIDYTPLINRLIRNAKKVF